jgi:hypothetical protein
MALHFHRIDNPVNELEIWSGSDHGFSFVISNANPAGPGLHGRSGFVASWRPVDLNRSAIKVGGSPFRNFAEAKKACEEVLRHLTEGSAKPLIPARRTPEL